MRQWCRRSAAFPGQVASRTRGTSRSPETPGARSGIGCKRLRTWATGQTNGAYNLANLRTSCTWKLRIIGGISPQARWTSEAPHLDHRSNRRLRKSRAILQIGENFGERSTGRFVDSPSKFLPRQRRRFEPSHFGDVLPMASPASSHSNTVCMTPRNFSGNDASTTSFCTARTSRGFHKPFYVGNERVRQVKCLRARRVASARGVRAMSRTGWLILRCRVPPGSSRLCWRPARYRR